MRKTALATVIVAATVALSACSTQAEPEAAPATTASQEATMEATTMETAAASAALTGTFEGLNEKAVAGTVEIVDGEIMLEGFSSDEGPDLHIYLANGTDEAAIQGGVSIDSVAWNEATQSFMLDGVDASDYSHVVIYCDKALAVFGAAPLA